MATDAENIIAMRSALLATLAAEAANPKPSYSIDGQSVDWNGYRSALLSQVQSLNAMLPTFVGVFEEIAEATT